MVLIKRRGDFTYAPGLQFWFDDYRQELDVMVLIKHFFIQKGDVWSNAFMTTSIPGILDAIAKKEFMKTSHNERNREWTQKDHENRIAYLISSLNVKDEPIELINEVIESSLYDVQILDGYHRLFAHYVMKEEKIMVKFPNKYEYELAKENLQA